MFKNSNELLDYAIREIQVAVKKKKSKVEIVLMKQCASNSRRIKRCCNNLEIEKNTHVLNEKFKDYDIKGNVKLEKIGTLTRLKSGQIEFTYPLTWILVLRKK